MDLTNYNSKELNFALDIGTRTVIGTVGIIREEKFYVLAESMVEHKERAMIDGQIHDISLVAEAVSTVKKDLEKKLGKKLKHAAIAAAGRFLKTITLKEGFELDENTEIDRDVIRSLEMSAVKSCEDKINAGSKGKLYCVGYSVKSYYLNGYIISNLLSHKGERVDVEIISTFLPKTVVESLYAVMEKVRLTVSYMTLEPIAAMEAVIPKNLRLLNIALIDIGAGTSDIAISSKDTVNAFGMVPLAGDEVTEIISENLMVDFNSAEKIKRNCVEGNDISFTDILGFENSINYKDLCSIVSNVVSNISVELRDRILELNGSKAPSAIFLVGGGAHTPLLQEYLQKELNIPVNRIGIKGRENVTECTNTDLSLGSTGVTVLGIALLASKKTGNDFIDVTLNGNVVSLFNSYRHTVMDVILQGNLNPKMLIGKNGKGLRFKLNGKNKTIFGELSESSTIKINGKASSIENEVRAGDNIEIKYAKNGKNAKAKPFDFLKEIYSLLFYVEGEEVTLEPFAMKNNKMFPLDDLIKEGDDIDIYYPKTLGDLGLYCEKYKDTTLYKDGKLLEENYEIEEDDRLTLKPTDEEKIENLDEVAKDSLKTPEEDYTSINVIANNLKIKMKNKTEYVFVDIFDYIPFDRTKAKGELVMLNNKVPAKFYDALKEGDSIEIYWK